MVQVDPLWPHEVRIVLKIRSLSALDWKSNKNYPLPSEYEATFWEIKGLQFLQTHPFVSFRVGHNPVNGPIRSWWTRERVTLIMYSWWRATSSISSSFLTNFGNSFLVAFFPFVEFSQVKASISGRGKAEGVADLPSLDTMATSPHP